MSSAIISCIECHTTEAVRVFSERGMNDKVKLLESSGSIYTYYYTLGGTADYYYGNLLPSTGFIHLFDLVKCYRLFVLFSSLAELLPH